MKTIRGFFHCRLPRRDDDTGSMAMLLMVIIVAAAIGSVMLAIIINQNSATRFGTTRVHALGAAQAGIDVMLGEIRDATSVDSSGTTYGDDDKLPCSPMSGSANGTGTGAYTVSIAYYIKDPSAGGQTPMVCADGYGPYDATTGSHTPRFALITSVGTDDTGASSITQGRTLTTTYIFRTDDVNIPGGEIQIYPDGSGNTWCMDAGSSTPASGTQLVLRACSTSTPPLAQQVFAYRTDLSIQLVSSVTSSYPLGLCIDTNPQAHANNVAMVLKPCNTVGTAAWNQQWSVDDNAHLRGANTSGNDTDGYCINAPSQTDGQPITLSSCAGSTQDTFQTWVPAATAGAGMAGATNNQIVNYKYFATCLDITGQNAAAPYEILYTCKQNPDPAKVLWNQKFATTPTLGPAATAKPTTVVLSTNNGTKYCLQSPLVNGGYPILSSTNCAAGQYTNWTWYQTLDSNGKPLTYGQVYTIQDSSGLCLSAGAGSDLYISAYYKVTVATCNGGTEQKWNADPTVLIARLTNTKEK